MFCERRPRRQHRIRPPNSHLATGYLQAYAAAIVSEISDPPHVHSKTSFRILYIRRREVVETYKKGRSRTDGASGSPAIQDVAKRVCSADLPLCTAQFADVSERQNCLASFDAVRRLVTEPVVLLTLERLRRAMDEAPE